MLASAVWLLGLHHVVGLDGAESRGAPLFLDLLGRHVIAVGVGLHHGVLLQLIMDVLGLAGVYRIRLAAAVVHSRSGFFAWDRHVVGVVSVRVEIDDSLCGLEVPHCEATEHSEGYTLNSSYEKSQMTGTSLDHRSVTDTSKHIANLAKLGPAT